MLVISNRPGASRSSDFEINRADYSLNCTPLGPITIAYHETYIK